MLLALALVLAACSEGYPGDDAPLLSPFEMSNAQRLAALNEIGQAGASGAARRNGERWHYRLQPGCRLELEQRPRGEPALRRQHALQRAMDVRLRHDAERGLYELQLMSEVGPTAERLGLLLRSPAWTDASRAELLLQLLIRDCTAAAQSAGRAAPL